MFSKRVQAQAAVNAKNLTGANQITTTIKFLSSSLVRERYMLSFINNLSERVL